MAPRREGDFTTQREQRERETNMGTTGKITRQARIGQIIAGIQKYFANLPTIDLAGTSRTPADLIAMLQKALDAIKQSSNAKAAWLAEVQTERNVLQEISPVLRYIKAFVVSKFGDTVDSGQKLEDFGYTPRKVPAKKVAVKAGAIAQGQATRVARATKGKKQKAKIKGAARPPQQPAR
jgi:hypothetical protein